MANGDPIMRSAGALAVGSHTHSGTSDESVCTYALGSGNAHLLLVGSTAISPSTGGWSTSWDLVFCRSADSGAVSNRNSFAINSAGGTFDRSFSVSSSVLTSGVTAPTSSASRSTIWGFSFNATTGAIVQRSSGAFGFDKHVQVAAANENFLSIPLGTEEQLSGLLLWCTIDATHCRCFATLVHVHRDDSTVPSADMSELVGGVSLTRSLTMSGGSLTVGVNTAIGNITVAGLYGFGTEISRS